MIPRLLASIAVGGLLVAVVAIARVRASASELASGLGPMLLAYAGATHDDGHRRLLVNGAELEMRTGTTADSIDTVLERQREACRSTTTFTPLLRWSSSAQGVLGCLVAPDGASLLERLRQLGELRVTWVMASGEARRYVIVSSREGLALSQMFPAHGDAPGFDAPGIPRPPHARRVLSAVQRGAEPVLVAYHSELDVAALERAYRDALESQRSGVERVPLREAGEARTLLVQGATSMHLVLLDEDDTGALAVILPLATQPRR